MYTAHSTYLFVGQWTLGLFPPLAIINNAALSVGVQILGCPESFLECFHNMGKPKSIFGQPDICMNLFFQFFWCMPRSGIAGQKAV